MLRVAHDGINLNHEVLATNTYALAESRSGFAAGSATFAGRR